MHFESLIIISMKLEVTTNTKKSASSFLKNHRTEIVEWADYINNNTKNILAISRKGPRLYRNAV
jgi:hypothetical protein